MRFPVFPRISRAFSLLVFSLVGVAAFGQTPLPPEQLPARTLFYMTWHGAPSGDLRQKNALMSLWDDADFAPVRAALVDGILSDAKKKKGQPPMTKEDVARYSSLLDNSFVIGYLPKKRTAGAAKPATAEGTGAASQAPAEEKWNGVFFVYDRTGKEELLSKTVMRLRGSEAEIPKLTEITVAGVKSLKVERKSGTTYWAENGKYAVGASERAVFEEILTRLEGKGAGDSLTSSSEYKEATPLLGGNLLEFFLRIPQAKDIVNDANADSPQLKMALSGLKLDALHVLAGRVVLDGAHTRLQGALLGDTAEGSLFDIFPAGMAKPASLAFVTPETVYYNESQFNLTGLFNTIKRTFLASGPNAASTVSILESAAQSRLGMPVADALSATTGEFATLQSSASLDPDKKLLVLGIANKANTLKVIRSYFADQVASEKSEGDVTYMKISLGGSQGSKGVAQWNFYHIAVTPTLLLGASKNETLRKTLADTAGDPALPAALVSCRGKFPEKLTGFSYFDLQKLDWAAMKQQWIASSKEASAKGASAAAAGTRKAGESKTPLRTSDQWLNDLDPAVFPRHLHLLSGASWKDAAGFHFDEWVD